MDKRIINQVFPFAEESFKQDITNSSKVINIPAKTVILKPGSSLDFTPIVLNGIINVYITLENGREILLYKIENNQTCMLTNLSIIQKTPYPAWAKTLEDTQCLIIPTNKALEFLDKYKYWRNFVLEMIAQNTYSILTTINEIISKRIDKRLINYLYERSKKSSTINITHEEIAKDLGTSREVITRLLKAFEEEDLLELGRGKIIIKKKLEKAI